MTRISKKEDPMNVAQVVLPDAAIVKHIGKKEIDHLAQHLKGYQKRQNAELKEAIAGALADLRHICDANDLDFGHLDALGYSHYCEENGR